MGYPWENQTAKSYPTRVISGQDILELQDGNQTLIGKTMEYCSSLENDLNEAISKAEEYYNELISAGLRTKPKTTEDMLLEVMNAIKYLSDKVDKMENEKNESKSNTDSSKGSAGAGKPKGGASTGQSTTDTASNKSPK